MTGGRFPGVDHDLLADFVGGALDGTPDETVVARLVDEDPAWSEAYARLVPALARVEDELARWGATPLTMPATVADRITAAISGAGPAAPADGVPAQAGATDAGRRLTVVGGEAPAGRRPPGRAGDTRRRRWARVAGPVAIAAAAVTVAGLGINQLVATRSADTASSAADQGGAAAPQAESVGPQVLLGPAEAPRRSGTDYSPRSLAGIFARATAPAPVAPGGSAGPDTAPPRGDDPRVREGADLRRLTDPTALSACLNAVAVEHDRGAVTVGPVDYAAFEGRPALVVGFLDGTGARWVWVTGPECGVPGSGADVRYRTQVS